MMNYLFSYLPFAILIGLGIYLSRKWRHNTLATMLFHPDERVLHELRDVGYAYRPVPAPGESRADSFYAGLSAATVRVTNQRIVIATPAAGGPAIRCAIYRDHVPPHAGASIDVGYIVGAVRDADVTEEAKGDKVRFELVTSGACPAERVWLETPLPGPIRAFFGRS